MSIHMYVHVSVSYFHHFPFPNDARNERNARKSARFARHRGVIHKKEHLYSIAIVVSILCANTPHSGGGIYVYILYRFACCCCCHNAMLWTNMLQCACGASCGAPESHIAACSTRYDNFTRFLMCALEVRDAYHWRFEWGGEGGCTVENTRDAGWWRHASCCHCVHI